MSEPRCRTCRFYEALTDDDRQFFNDQVAEPRPKITRLYGAALAAGLDAAPSTFRYHLYWHHKPA